MAAKVRISVDQEKLFKTSKKPKGAPRAPRIKKKRTDLPENQVAKQIIDFLQAKGFRCKRQHRGLFFQKRGEIFVPVANVGEKGEVDWRCTRPIFPKGQRIDAKRDAVPHLVFELEMKAPNKRPDAEQLKYIRERNETGTPATWANSLDMFKAWFEKMHFDVWIH